eukprot:6989413-Pyramimonas_sp.AAC.1
MNLTHHRTFSFGWERGKHTNKSAGCAIFVRKRTIRTTRVHEVRATPTELAGRGGMLRLKSGHFDVTLIAAYYPPPSNMAVDAWRATCKKVTDWVHRTIRMSKQRSPVVV